MSIMYRLVNLSILIIIGTLFLSGCKNSASKSESEEIDEKYAAVVAKLPNWDYSLGLSIFTAEQTDSCAIEILAGKFLDYGGDFKGYDNKGVYSNQYPFFVDRDSSLNLIDWAMLVRRSRYHPQDVSLSDEWRISAG